MIRNDFQIQPVFVECSHNCINGGEPNLEQLIFNYYSRYFDGQVALSYTQRYIDTLLAMSDTAFDPRYNKRVKDMREDYKLERYTYEPTMADFRCTNGD